jgi:predicted RNA-binding Zn ribbon-like protein
MSREWAREEYNFARLKYCEFTVMRGILPHMRGRGSIPTELRGVESILNGERLIGSPGSISADSDTEAWAARTTLRDRLILRLMATMVPIAAGEFKERYSDAVAKVRRESPKLFTSSGLPVKKPGKRKYDNQADQRRREKAAGRLREWIEAWITHGKSTALLMRARPDIESALQKWWEAPKRFEWPVFPEQQGIGMLDARRPSAEAIACKAFWTVITHPAGTRFTICKSCGLIFYASRLGKRPRLYCPNPGCGSRNSVKPYMVKAEEQKLEAARQLLSLAKDKPNWKSWVLAQPAALDAEITSHWLTRRINSKMLSLPDTLESAG